MSFKEEIFPHKSCCRTSGLSNDKLQIKPILPNAIPAEQRLHSDSDLNNLQHHFACEDMDIYNFINPQTSHNAKKNGHTLQGNEGLDSAHHCTRGTDKAFADPFYSSEDIIKFHAQLIASRTHAFNHLTQCDNVNLWQDLFTNTSAPTNLEHEFQQLIVSDNLMVFIEEFELLISKLNTQQSVIHKNTGDIEGLIHFKVSIHLIKHLSEMMQAVHLKHYSHTVIEFLEDLVDGKTHITSDVTERLSIVVDYFYYYKNSISFAG